MRLLASSLLLSAVLLCFTPTLNQAQDLDPSCTIDLSTALATLADAQVSASNGDQKAALETIATVHQQLQDIEASCEGLLAPPDLSQSYTAPDELFTFQYPSDWVVSPFKEGWEWDKLLTGITPAVPIPPGGSVALSNDTEEEDPFSESLGGVPEAGSRIFVSVGSPLHILESTGAYTPETSTTFAEEGFTLETLGDQFAAALSQTDEDLRASTVEAAYPTLALDLRETETPFYILLVALNEDENQYAVLIGTAEMSERNGLPGLVEAIADTLQVPDA